MKILENIAGHFYLIRKQKLDLQKFHSKNKKKKLAMRMNIIITKLQKKRKGIKKK